MPTPREKLEKVEIMLNDALKTVTDKDMPPHGFRLEAIIARKTLNFERQACLANSQGRFADAIALYEKAIQITPFQDGHERYHHLIKLQNAVPEPGDERKRRPVAKVSRIPVVESDEHHLFKVPERRKDTFKDANGVWMNGYQKDSS